MTAAAAGPAEPDRIPFVDASPSRIRDALTPEDVVAFDRHWQRLMQRRPNASISPSCTRPSKPGGRLLG
ncbi:hypothetical protein [Pseudonocardia sp.]|uniref:hypothetical protein n=1 Tax=Pseudonocardia sp. TaxID=60912 RepID=UPI00261114CE|nr:hypothetical protein [Pseudonocardia sp.]